MSYTSIQDEVAPRADDAALASMSVHLEVRDPAVADDLLTWQGVDGSESTLERSMNGVVASWSGVVGLPPGDGSPRRLVVTEQDHLATDAGVLAARVIYADVFPIGR